MDSEAVGRGRCVARDHIPPMSETVLQGLTPSGPFDTVLVAEEMI